MHHLLCCRINEHQRRECLHAELRFQYNAVLVFFHIILCIHKGLIKVIGYFILSKHIIRQHLTRAAPGSVTVYENQLFLLLRFFHNLLPHFGLLEIDTAVLSLRTKQNSGNQHNQ